MRRDWLFICIICFAIIGCKGQDSNVKTINNSSSISFEEKQKKDLFKNYSDTASTENNTDFNFRVAAKKAIPGVAHIRSTYSIDSQYDFQGQFNEDFWYRFFSDGHVEKPQSDASGVLVSSDGYIVTNDHVVADAEDIEVMLYDQRTYKAKIIGIDPATDLALLKIKETNLPFIEFGNSDEIEVGDWVLAVGNPFNLISTVTAGIISAKARGISTKKDGKAESFIQTDAAVNRGNSGGALVDFNGKLIGINSIIATPTGAYAGYSFATPVNTVKKIINDLLTKGKAQRGYLGLISKNMSAGKAKELKTDITVGVYVDSIYNGGAAMEANIKRKDIITAIDDYKIKTSAQLQEMVDRHRPNEKVFLTIVRDGKEKRVPITLKGVEGVFPKTATSKMDVLKNLGIVLAELSENEKHTMEISSGVKIEDILKGKIYTNTNIKKGFIITKVNAKPVNNVKEFVKAFENTNSIIMLEGIYPDFPAIIYYTFSLN